MKISPIKAKGAIVNEAKWIKKNNTQSDFDFAGIDVRVPVGLDDHYVV